MGLRRLVNWPAGQEVIARSCLSKLLGGGHNLTISLHSALSVSSVVKSFFTEGSPQLSPGYVPARADEYGG